LAEDLTQSSLNVVNAISSLPPPWLLQLRPSLSPPSTLNPFLSPSPNLPPLPSYLFPLLRTQLPIHFPLHLRFLRRVSLRPQHRDDFNVEEEGSIFSDEALPPPQQEQSFSADHKLFVGNLPFNVDSAQLAKLFESAGNVEMVEAAAQQFNGYVRRYLSLNLLFYADKDLIVSSIIKLNLTFVDIIGAVRDINITFNDQTWTAQHIMINSSTTVSLTDQLKPNILAIGVAKVIVATSINPKSIGGNIRLTIPGCYLWDSFLL
ncbi:LOW QUALITY PROTEIN: hypothetical protein HID58_056086, partial [Brassica napus]